mmetsp:Transcript_25750/g.43952  ORF Transcript_25750/g.43952 Transcript_25750/m.43952 type:complete len:93 (+) Transcript_25750:685-963(+)
MAAGFGKFTKPFKPGGPKRTARAGKLINPDNPHYADEHLFNNDIVALIRDMFPDAFNDGTFDDDDATKDMLEPYFSLISIDEAKELVMDAYD